MNETEKEFLESKFQKAKHNLNELGLRQKQSQEFRNCSFKANDNDDVDVVTLLNTESRVHKMLVKSITNTPVTYMNIDAFKINSNDVAGGRTN